MLSDINTTLFQLYVKSQELADLLTTSGDIGKRAKMNLKTRNCLFLSGKHMRKEMAY